MGRRGSPRNECHHPRAASKSCFELYPKPLQLFTHNRIGIDLLVSDLRMPMKIVANRNRVLRDGG